MSYNDSFEFVPCDTCGAIGAPDYIRMADHLCGMPGIFTIAKCRSCGLLFTNPRPNLNVLDSLYGNYYSESAALSRSENPSISQRMKRNTSLRKTYHHVFGNYLGEVLSKAKGSVLDIGCGLGETLEDLKKLGCECSGIEPNSAAARMSKEKGLNVKCSLADELNYPENFFDTVILFHVIEHLQSPKNTCRRSSRF